MKIKHLIILALLAALLGIWTYRSRRQEPTQSIIGARVFPELPLNDINSIIITTPGSTVTVARIDTRWLVPSRYNHPACFKKISDTMIKLADMTIGQVVNLTDNQLGELKLLSPKETSEQEIEQTGTLIELFDAEGRLIEFLVIGKQFLRSPESDAMPMDLRGYPAGQYIRRSDNKVMLVSQTLGRLEEDQKTWLDDELLNISASELKEITVAGPDRDTLHIKRDDGDKWAVVGIDQESVDTAKVNRMAGALRYLSLDDVASPNLSPEQTGLKNPVTFQATTRQGQVFNLAIGDKTEDGTTRYLQGHVHYQQSDIVADTNDAIEIITEQSLQDQRLTEKTELLNARLQGWTYKTSSFRTDAMLLQREDMIKAP